MFSQLDKTFDGVIKHPTTVIELTLTQWKRFKDNSIQLSQICYNGDKSHIYHKGISFGKNINLTKSASSRNSNESHRRINLEKTKGRYIMIVTNKTEFLKVSEEVFAFSSIMSYNDKDLNTHNSRNKKKHISLQCVF